jgi:polyhydroxybutyrate depolymerase
MQLRGKLVLGAAVAGGVSLILVLAAVLAIFVLDRSTATLVSSGQQREYLLHVPASYDRNKPTPLVISLHGASLWPALQMKISQWNRVADQHGFIVAYPSAGGFPKIWHVDRVPGLAVDVRFIADLIDALAAQYNIDPARIYANGMSNGGGMAFVLSCTLSDRIAAIGMVSAAQSLAWDWCTDRRPVPMISFHGTADPVIPYAGGPSPVGPAATFPSVPGWAANWAQRNGCRSDAVDSSPASDVMRSQYEGCSNGATVALYTVKGGGHAWPGGAPLPAWIVGPTTQSVDASSLMWQFFMEHPLPGGGRASP